MKTKCDKIFTFHTLHDKEHRSLSMLELIRKKGMISRTDISRATGINVVSVSNYISNFIEKNILLEKGHAVSSGGRKPELVELNAKENYVLGLDISADSISAMLVDIGMNTVTKKKAVKPEKSRDLVFAAGNIIKDVMESAGLEMGRIRAIGISIYCESLIPVRDAIEKRYGIDTFIGDAASCGAFAEKRFAPDVDAGKLLYIYSDVGRGILIDGETCVGCSIDNAAEEPGVAGSAGDDNNIESLKGLKYLGPWDRYLGVVEMAKREVERGVGTKMVSLSGGYIDKITEAVVVDAARQNDETALNIVQSMAINLGLRTAYLINLFHPDTVVISGGPEKAPELTLPLINKMIKRLSLKKYADTVKILPSAFGEDGICMGASALAVREVFLKS